MKHIEPTEEFVVHPSITEWLTTNGDFKANGTSFMPTIVEVDRPYLGGDVRVFEGHLNVGQAWVKLAVTVRSNSHTAIITGWTGYGRSSISAPIIARGKMKIVDAKTGGMILDLDQGNQPPVLNSQATPPRVSRFNFTTGGVVPMTGPAPMQATKYAPAYPQQTGGSWPYMGYSIVKHEGKDLGYWRNELAAIGNYPGNLLNDDGSFVHEKQIPDAVLAGGMYFDRNAPAYINYSDSYNPWRDRSAYEAYVDKPRRWTTCDDQHLCIYDALCEAWMEWPEAEDFRWLILSAAHRYLLQFPGHDKGTYRWDPGQARGRGRILKTGVKLYHALEKMGQADLANDVAVRVSERLQNQINEFRADIVAGRAPWPNHPLGGPAPHELGIWWWGLDWCDRALPGGGAVAWPELHYMKAAIARYCFDAFREWPDYSGNRGWAPPYVIYNDGRTLAPSSGGFFCWMAAISHTGGDPRKLEELVALGESYHPRYKG